MDATPVEPLGAVLAGGAARRLGGAKAKAELAGRPLIAYPLAAFAAAGIEAVVVAKPDSELPPLGVPLVTEPAEPTHPLLGVVTALEHGDGRPVVVCPCDTPFVTAELLGRLAAAGSSAAVADRERIHPLIARLEPASAAPLRDALQEGRSATAAVAALRPALIRVEERVAFNVNTPDDFARAESLILEPH